MNNIMRKILLCVTLLTISLCHNYIIAQNDGLEIEVRETIKQQCIHKVKALTDHFAKIAMKDEADSIKDYHIEACMDLFVGGGNDTKDDEGNVIIPAPRIEVSSLATGKKNSYFIRIYLERLKRLKYTKVVFKTSDCYLADGGVKKIGENQYSATVTFYQVFIGYNGDMIVYRDKTKKTVNVIIKRDNLGRFDVLLGNIKVDETTETDQR